jgi:hypothetical protein
VQLFGIPGVKLTEITSLEKMGSHHYLGDQEEENGIIYTRRGGFIDMGHLRDQIDWMAYLFIQLSKYQKNGDYSLVIGREGGVKTLELQLSPDLTSNDLILLSGKIAYDLSVWHEIATWFGASSIPFIPERYSSFSVEDAYSNLLGVTIGIEALKSELKYETAVTRFIASTLKDLDAVAEYETYLAMEAVRNVWWTRDKRLPSGKVLIEREVQVYDCLQPWLVSGWVKPGQKPMELKVPQFTSKGELLNKFYTLEFKLNYKFPFHKMFPERKYRSITQEDFEQMLTEISSEIRKKENRNSKINQ